MPVFPGQLTKIGHDCAKEYLQRQREARGMDADHATETSTPPFPFWTPEIYGDVTLSAEDWGRQALRDCNAGIFQGTNHICRPSTCYEGKWAKKTLLSHVLLEMGTRAEQERQRSGSAYAWLRLSSSMKW